MEAQSKARLVEASPSAERGVTATVARSEIEDTLKSDTPALLVLDIARRTGGSESDVEAHTLEVELEKPDLEKILHTATGEAIELRFDGGELEQALEGDVDAHGLREKALILSVAVATAAGVAGQASGMPVLDRGAGATSAISAAASSAPMSDVVSGGPAGAQAAETQFASDVVSGGPAGAQAAESQFASDVVSGGTGQAAEQAQLASEVSGGPEWPRAAAASADETTLVSDVVSGGPAGQTAAETPLVSDVVSGGPATTVTAAESAGGGGGISISSSDMEAGLASGLAALLITGAGFAALKQRRPVSPS